MMNSASDSAAAHQLFYPEEWPGQYFLYNPMIQIFLISNLFILIWAYVTKI